VGTLVNAGAILAGAGLGLGLRGELSARHQFVLKTVLGVLVVLAGFRLVWMGLGGTLGRVAMQVVLALVSLVLGNLVGKLLGLQKGSNRLGRYARERFAEAGRGGAGKSVAGDGLMTCAILFCVAPMAILGALVEGARGDPTVLCIKAAMDGMAAFAFARVFGPAVAVSALPVLAWQGTITLGVRALGPMVGLAAVWDGVTVVAGLLVATTSLVILEVKRVPLADYLPSLLVGALLWGWWVGG
jgi:uncharacterized membrane protein YqgA involved in biofilm formation